MTRLFIFITSFLLMIFNGIEVTITNNTYASEKIAIGRIASKTTSGKKVESQGNALPGSANSTSPLHEENHSKTPALDETPHIHHFHKERMKKITKHHNKLWYLSQLILVVCQLSLLIIGYMHIIH